MKDYDEIDPKKYEEMYEIIPKENYMKKHWGPIIEKTVEKYCNDKDVLDLGCGYGRYSTIINRYAKNVYGLDVSKRWLKYLKNKKNISNILWADAHSIPLKDKSFDVVVCIGLFEYINRTVVIKEIYRSLKPNSYCILQVPNKYSAFRLTGKLISKIFKTQYYTSEPSKKEMLKLFGTNGFELIEYKMDDGLIWLPNFLDRSIGKRVYHLIENFFKIFGKNPFSNVMFFIVRKMRQEI